MIKYDLAGKAAAFDVTVKQLSTQIIGEYVEQWVTSIEDHTPRVRKIYELLQSGKADQAKRHLPPEKIYPVGPALARRLSAGTAVAAASAVALELQGSRSLQ